MSTRDLPEVEAKSPPFSRKCGILDISNSTGFFCCLRRDVFTGPYEIFSMTYDRVEAPYTLSCSPSATVAGLGDQPSATGLETVYAFTSLYCCERNCCWADEKQFLLPSPLRLLFSSSLLFVFFLYPYVCIISSIFSLSSFRKIEFLSQLCTEVHIWTQTPRVFVSLCLSLSISLYRRNSLHLSHSIHCSFTIFLRVILFNLSLSHNLKLRNEELHDLYSVLSINKTVKSRRMRLAGHVTRMRENRNAWRLLVGKPEGNRQLGRQRRRWANNKRMDPAEVGWSDVERIGLTQDRDRWRALVNSVLNLQVL
jgi:hypothetical protein